MTQDTKDLIAYFQKYSHILPKIIVFFSWKSRRCTPVEAVLFWKSVSDEERQDYFWAIDDAVWDIQMGHGEGEL